MNERTNGRWVCSLEFAMNEQQSHLRLSRKETEDNDEHSVLINERCSHFFNNSFHLWYSFVTRNDRFKSFVIAIWHNTFACIDDCLTRFIPFAFLFSSSIEQRNRSNDPSFQEHHGHRSNVNWNIDQSIFELRQNGNLSYKEFFIRKEKKRNWKNRQLKVWEISKWS